MPHFPSVRRLYRRQLTLLGAVLLLIAASSAVLPAAATPSLSAPPHSLLALPPQPARDNDLRFKHLSLEQGLSQSVVGAILQDDLGFMWFATQDGLNRFDGYDFRVYRNDPSDANSLGDGVIQALCEGQGEALWVGTNDGGLCRYDLTSGQFRSYRNDPNDPASLASDDVAALYEDGHGVLWVGTTGGGLNRLAPGEDHFVRYVNDPNDPRSLSANIVTAIAQTRDRVMWIGTFGGGLNRFNPETGQFIGYLNDPEDASSLVNNSVSSLCQDRDGWLWIGTNGGLDRFDPAAERFVHFHHDPEDPHSLSSDVILSVYQDPDGALWVGTPAGLNRYDPLTQGFVHYTNDPSDPFSLNNSQVQAIYRDRSGVLWVGTFGGGLNLADPTTARFTLFQNRAGDPDSLGSDFIWAVYQDRRGDYWVGHGSGLDRLDPVTGRSTHLVNDPANPQSLRPGTVMAIQEDLAGALWLGLWDGGLGGGVDRYDRDSGVFVHYQTPATFAVAQDTQGALWIGTFAGLGKYDPAADSFAYYVNDPGDDFSLSDNGVVNIYPDDDGRLWLGTFNGGMNLFDPATERSIRYMHDPADPHSVSSNTVLCMHDDGHGTLWLGTAAGLNRFDQAAGTFRTYTTHDGLPNDVIYGIEGDSQGRLWMTTNRGLSRFDPQTETFRNYGAADGLPSMEFNQNASLRDRDGHLFFGSIAGLAAFDPASLRDNEYVPPVVFTSLTQSGQSLSLGRTVERTSELILGYPNNQLEFEFAALGYTQPEKSQYAYMLDGFDKGWIQSGARRFGRYTNIPGGTYTLRVRASNNDGLWGEQAASLAITVVPPVWETWWFRLLAGGVAILGVFSVFRLRVRVIEAQRRQLALQVAQKTRELRETLVELRRAKDAAEAANRAKSVFLANMSHELRTPLNAILGFAQLMGRDRNLSPVQQENMAVINRSGEHLLGLINDVLQLSKIEAGRLALNDEAFDLWHLLDGLEEMFRLRATEKAIDLTFHRDADVPRFVSLDQGKLRQVLMNLLSNAVKFTEAGSVTMRVGSYVPAQALPGGLALHFEVRDSGPGIAPEEVRAIFEPFEQGTVGRKYQEGTGLGLTISQQLVGMMGGELAVISPVPELATEGGAGSLFRFDVPATSVEASAAAGAPVRRVVGLAPGQPVYRLLIVEDNWANRRLLHQLLAPLGFEIREATDGQEALALWDTWIPHLIFMDMRMPVMDGYEATRRIRATTKGQATVIIALTASVLDEEREVILSEGCNAFLRKPFREAELFDAITRYLGVRFVYETEAFVPPVQATTKERDAAALRAALAVLPPEWIDDLRHATASADLAAISAAIARIRTQDAALAGTLTALADAFDHSTILEMVTSPEDTSDQEEGSDARHES